ncbi:MAG TPA: MauE/DoxX family redox-associated membrane protein [Opitutaceae bacterium]|jgi:putative oxidoreductase|nr:MauE/DoxX family redox-associated membrane protein [Opitutaceae bacterium]
MKWLKLLLRLLAVGVFLVAGVLKVLDPAHFAADIDHFRLLPYFMVAPLALYLPWLEIICGLAVFTGAWRRSALGLLFAMNVVFIAAITSAWMRGLDIRCGCFGAASTAPLAYDLAFDVVLCGVLFWLLRAERRPGSPPAQNI